jgi:hypothetical protein
MSFELGNYSIISSLNERSIYIKVIDKITFMCYENNIDMKELRLNTDLDCAYQMITNCFNKSPQHIVAVNLISGVMKMIFNVNVGGYLRMNFEILLREKVMSNDSQLTMNFHRMEQTQLQAIQMLTQRLSQLEELVDAISYAEIYMLNTTYTVNHNSNKLYWKVNTKELNLTANYWDYTKIKLFYQLEKLTFTSCTDIGASFKTQNISNKTVKELALLNIPSGINSLIGLDGFPNLERFTMVTCPTIRDIVAVLSGYDHKIKFIKIQACQGINNTELMTYCQKNNITLELA